MAEKPQAPTDAQGCKSAVQVVDLDKAARGLHVVVAVPRRAASTVAEQEATCGNSAKKRKVGGVGKKVQDAMD